MTQAGAAAALGACAMEALADEVSRGKLSALKMLAWTFACIVIYTISTGAVMFEQVPEKLPWYPISVVRLGRLAIDLRSQGLYSYVNLFCPG